MELTITSSGLVDTGPPRYYCFRTEGQLSVTTDGLGERDTLVANLVPN